MNTAMKKLRAVWQLLRVYQWTKNLLVLAALIFAREAGNPEQVLRALIALGAFCLASSGVYVFNDIIDRAQDRAHPSKRRRPLASGALSAPFAAALSAGLLGSGFALGWFGLRAAWAGEGLAAPFEFTLALSFYVALTLSYSLVWKHLIIVDVLALAMGFVVRAMAGAVALDIVFSKWLVVCTLFLALFLALGKRRHEITLLDEGAQNHRAVLQHYTTHYLDALILIVAGGALLTYTIYTCSPEVEENFGTDKLYVTLPFVVYGLFRYLFLVQHRTGGGDPSRTLLRDWPLGLTVLLWGIANIVIIYWR